MKRRRIRQIFALLLAVILLFHSGDCASMASAGAQTAGELTEQSESEVDGETPELSETLEPEETVGEEPSGQPEESVEEETSGQPQEEPGEDDQEEAPAAGETPELLETPEPEDTPELSETPEPEEIPEMASGEEIAIDGETFPDENLQRAIAELADTDGDLRLSLLERETVTSLDLSHRELFSLRGLELFESLEELDCSWNHLSREEIEPFEDLKKLQYYDNTYLVGNDDEEIEDWEELPEETAGEDEAEEKPWRFTFLAIRSADDFQDVPLDADDFPDEQFREYLRERYDADADGILSADEQKQVTSLCVRGEEICDLTGIGIFQNLLLLDCSENLLTQLDVHELPRLRGLFCTDNQITRLDLSDSLELKKLECDEDVEVYGWVPPRMTKEDGERAKATAEIKVGTPKLKKLTNPKSEVLTATYSKVSGAAGYQLQLAKNKKFTSGVQKEEADGTSCSFKKLDQGATCYVRVRAFRYDSENNKVYGSYSAAKSLKITKGRVWTEASAGAVKLSSVALVNKSTVRMKASAAKYVKSADDYYYVFNLTPAESSPPASRKPIAKLEKAKSLSIDLPLKYNTVNNRIQYKFTFGVKTKKSGSYKLISAAKFISNPEKRATATGAFPKSSTKKGLQVNEFYIPDAAELGVKHTTYNMCLDNLFAVSSEQNTSRGIAYEYAGKTYWFSKGIVQSYDRTLNSFKEKNMIVSAIILLRYRSDLTHLMVNSSQRSGFYALKTSSVTARRPLEAAFTFLANRYAKDGRIANWIIGNEVNNYTTYHYTGSAKLSYNAKVYANAFRLAYISIRSVYSKARVYISLDHLWNVITATGHGSKQFLDKFANYWDSYGTCCVAYHAYPWPMTAPEFWNKTSDITNSSGTRIINMQNLGVLTNYVKKKFGSGSRVILSEQGFTSKKYGANVEQTQAAAIVYAYYIAEFNSMVDAFILQRHIDHQEEVNQGLALGLWTNKAGTTETPGVKKYAYSVFKKMDTAKYKSNVKFALPIIGKASWKVAVPGFDPKRFS